ncbi:MAG: hypothetical protein B6D41_04015 [Chloroflexi bacterium UTCFX4]|nr:MAG: hypothetical protein B6D41_04015 [Chloroflexi bacterium UTCFX4]
MNDSLKFNRRQIVWLVIAFGLGALVIGAIAFMLLNIQQRKDEALAYPLNVVTIADTELNPEVWGKNYPREFSSWLKTQRDDTPTAFGGSQPFDKLERYPILKRLWAGYAFSVDYKEERGHYYALTDQKDTERQNFIAQPGACANCHAGEAPQLIQQMGWENFNRAPYKEISATLHYGSTCADCHDPRTMDLRITRPALVNALTQQGVDWTQATRQEMRTLVCAQCHVEYYFKGENKLLTLPWSQGTTVDAIEKHYAEYAFDEALKQRIVDIQTTTAGLLRRSEDALGAAMDAILAAQNAGATDEQLVSPRDFIRKAQLRWDFVFSENSTGFHSPQEAARILGEAIDYARQAQLAAERLNKTAK